MFAQEQAVAIHLIDMAQDSELSATAASLADGWYDASENSWVRGYELSDGTPVQLADWYRTDWPDTRVDMLTQFGDDFGLLWGFTTGEHGEKYTIDPSLRLGFVTQAHPLPNAVLSLSVRGTFWGDLTEHTCEADYGDIAGIQTVNCRLAATVLPPEETLQYLAHAEPNRLHISLSYTASF
ncbi:hypothetical protein [Devosia sp. A16]|uniref:hypothetical protein n=1 Tax=Devosia sp. A16 TaxID=1736675 RepID=UPI0006D77BE5|nr:hypothetical protein [Devosia sp. A16]